MDDAPATIDPSVTRSDHSEPSWRHRVLSRLRRRAVWPVAASAVAAVFGMIVAWLFMPVQYSAEAQITARIDWKVLPIDDALREKIKLHDSSPVALHIAKSDDVLRRAVEVHQNVTDKHVTVDELRRRTAVVPQEGGHGFTITVDSSNQSLADDLLKAIIQGLAPSAQPAAVMAVIDEIREAADVHDRAALSREHAVKKLEALRVAQGQPRAEQRVVFLQAELARIDRQIAALNVALAGVNEEEVDKFNGSTASLYAALARDDEPLADMLSEQQSLDEQLEKMHRTMGRNAPALIKAEKDLAELERDIEIRVRSIQALRISVGSDKARMTLALTPVELMRRRDALTAMRHGTKTSLDAATADAQVVIDHEKAITAADQQIDRASREVETLLATSPLPLRFARSDGGATTFMRDTRSRNQAVLFSGITIGLIGLIACAWFIGNDHKLRHAADIAIDGLSVQVLTQLPLLEDAPDAAERARQTCLAVHQLRGLIEIRMQTKGCDTFAITSPGRGSGKTSLTVALACSLAKSGIRTLLVDFDLLGRSTPNQTMDVDVIRGQNLGQAMIQMGYVDESEADIIVVPRDRKIGVQGFLQGQDLAACIIETKLPKLSILPTVDPGLNDLDLVSLRTVRRLIEQARRDFDLVLFDTGPIPGSVDSLVVASAADEVITIASRGETQTQFDKMCSQLRMAGARMGGTVFNRTLPRDLLLPASVTARFSKTPATAPQVYFDRSHGSGMVAAAVLDGSQPETMHKPQKELAVVSINEKLLTATEDVAEGATASDVSRELDEDAGDSSETSSEMEVFAPLLAGDQTSARRTRTVTGGYDGDNDINDALDHIMHSAINAGKRTSNDDSSKNNGA